MTGQFVISKAGHDKGTIYMIVAEEEEFVYLSDGQLKTPENPKKKNCKSDRSSSIDGIARNKTQQQCQWSVCMAQRPTKE